MFRPMGVLVLGLLIAGCPASPNHPVEPGVVPLTGPPDLTECGCADFAVFAFCSDDNVCQQSASAECDNRCAAHNGLKTQECTKNAVSCLLGSKSDGASQLICPCADGDDGACTSLSCNSDADVITEICWRFCPGTTEQPLCAASPSCAAGNAPVGRSGLGCACQDGTSATTCTVADCGRPIEEGRDCAALCSGHGGPSDFGLTCSVIDVACALGDGGNGVTCHCTSAADVGGCTALDCAADAALIKRACDDACAQLSSPPGASAPTCTADDSCAAGGPPHGPDEAFCHCLDDSFVETCSAGCADCSGECATHGGLSNAIVDGCSQGELFCLLGGAGGSSALTCTCTFDGNLTETRCGPISCNDAAAVAATCDELCAPFGGQSASPTCVPDDVAEPVNEFENRRAYI